MLPPMIMFSNIRTRWYLHPVPTSDALTLPLDERDPSIQGSSGFGVVGPDRGQRSDASRRQAVTRDPVLCGQRLDHRRGASLREIDVVLKRCLARISSSSGTSCSLQWSPEVTTAVNRVPLESSGWQRKHSSSSGAGILPQPVVARASRAIAATVVMNIRAVFIGRLPGAFHSDEKRTDSRSIGQGTRPQIDCFRET